MAPCLSVSNIGFPAAEFDAALVVLRELGIDAVEIAPYNVFGHWEVGHADIRALRSRLEDAGLRCPAMQGILYNSGPAHLFASSLRRESLYRHLVFVAQMAGRLGAHACVFGAPKLRDPGDLPEEAAREIAVEFLRRIGPVFDSEGSTLSFEPNARRYACRFITTTAEALDLVEAVDVPGIGLQIDTGTVFLEGEDPEILARAASHAAHAHVSEPDLSPIGESGVEHTPLAEALRKGGYQGSLSIEMKSVPDWRSAISRAVALTREIYIR